MPERMMAPFWNMRAGEQASGLRRVNALAGGGLIEQAVDHVDLVLQRFERRQSLAELHVGARAFGAPVFLIDAVAHEHDPEALREDGGSGGIAERRQRFQPRQGHRDSGAAKNRSAGDASEGGLR